LKERRQGCRKDKGGRTLSGRKGDPTIPRSGREGVYVAAEAEGLLTSRDPRLQQGRKKKRGERNRKKGKKKALSFPVLPPQQEKDPLVTRHEARPPVVLELRGGEGKRAITKQ